MTTRQLLRALVLSAIFVFSQASHAAGIYYDYLADLYLQESNQARNPNPIIRYADSEKGALLQSVLAPARVKTVLNIFQTSTQHGEQLPDVLKLLLSICTRYDAAFKNEPKAYENEYLDSIEALMEVMTTGVAVANQSLQQTMDFKQSKADSNSQKDILEKLQPMVKMARDMNTMALKAVTTEIRNRVARGMFSEGGTKRALDIAKKFSPQ